MCNYHIVNGQWLNRRFVLIRIACGYPLDLSRMTSCLCLKRNQKTHSALMTENALCGTVFEYSWTSSFKTTFFKVTLFTTRGQEVGPGPHRVPFGKAATSGGIPDLLRKKENPYLLNPSRAGSRAVDIAIRNTGLPASIST